MSTFSAWRLKVSSVRAATRASRSVPICSNRWVGLISVPAGCQQPHSSTTSLILCSGSKSPRTIHWSRISVSIWLALWSCSYHWSVENLRACPVVPQ